MKKVIIAINQLNEAIGKAVSWLTLALVLLVCGDVLIRYVLNDTRVWIGELEWHLFALIFLLGAGYAFKQERHVRVDLFFAKMSSKDRALVNLIGGLFFLLPWCIFVIWVSFHMVGQSYWDAETSDQPGGLPYRWLIKAAIPTGFFLLLLQGISSILQAIEDYRTT